MSLTENSKSGIFVPWPVAAIAVSLIVLLGGFIVGIEVSQAKDEAKISALADSVSAKIDSLTVPMTKLSASIERLDTTVRDANLASAAAWGRIGQWQIEVERRLAKLEKQANEGTGP